MRYPGGVPCVEVMIVPFSRRNECREMTIGKDCPPTAVVGAVLVLVCQRTTLGSRRFLGHDYVSQRTKAKDSCRRCQLRKPPSTNIPRIRYSDSPVYFTEA